MLCKAWRSNFRNMLGRTALHASAATRALTRSVSFQPGATLEAQIIRFAGLDGEQHFGTMVEDGTQARLLERAASGKMLPSDTIVPIHRILPPIDPIAIYGVGLNYRDHAAETGKEVPQLPILFMKAPSSVTGHLCPIVIPHAAAAKPEVDAEAELAVVIGSPAKDVAVADALSYVLGYTVANDVSARRWQGKKGGGQWTFAKSFDTFCPLGPYIVPRSLVPDPQNLVVRCSINGKVTQEGNTRDMVFPVAELIAHASQGTTLAPGTVILTGTPAGVGVARDPPVFLSDGDVVEVQVQDVGTLRNVVQVQANPDTGNGAASERA